MRTFARSGVVVLAALIALTTMYRFADAQNTLIDINTVGDEAEPLIQEVNSFVRQVKCTPDLLRRYWIARIDRMLAQTSLNPDAIGVGGQYTGVDQKIIDAAVTRIRNYVTRLKEAKVRLNKLPNCDWWTYLQSGEQGRTEIAAAKFGCNQSLAGISATPSVMLCSQVVAGVELGGGWGRATYDLEHFDTSGFVVGAFAGWRSYQPNNQMFGVQLSVLSTNMRASDFNAGLNWAVPLDFQVGTLFQSPVLPVPMTAYVFIGPMWGQVRVKDSFSTEHFSMFGFSAGAGLDLHVSEQWSVGTKVRAYTLGPAERKSEGQQQSGVFWTANMSYAFNPRW